MFQINFDAYEAEPSKSENNLLILKDTVSQRALGNFTIPGSLQKLSGNVHIFTYQEPKREEVVDASTRVEVVDVSTCICSYSSKRHMKVSPHVPIRTNVGTIPFTVNMTARVASPVGPRDQKERWSKLIKVVKDLSYQEIQQLGEQLGLGTELMETIRNETTNELELPVNVVKKWRELKERDNTLVSKLQQALEAIGRQEIN
ncbi:uncharacterized protein [Argopecten irradians]|uniref:uncharacterized protein n=1 Tax=Argopecten irradians TaxID=31199 RepID=UPI00372250B7